MWGPLGCLGLLLFITAMNKRIMISEILPSSSGCKFNSFKNRCNPFASMRASLIRFCFFLVPYSTGGVGKPEKMEGMISVGPTKTGCV